MSNDKGLGDLLEFNPYEEQDHMDQCEYNMDYDTRFQKWYNILKMATSKGSANTKIRKFDKTKDGVLDYSELWSYYYLYGEKYIYDQT